MKTKEEILRLDPERLNSPYYMRSEVITPTDALNAMEEYASQDKWISVETRI